MEMQMRQPSPDIDYDSSSADSIVRYAMILEGSTLRKELNIPNDQRLDRKGKGGFGQSVEFYYFGYDLNSRQAPDFEKVGIELKVTPLKIIAGDRLVPKERLVITMIDYHAIINEWFETSSLMKKLSSVLLMHYLHDDEVDPFDYEFKLVHLWAVPGEDYFTIKADWELIANKIRSGLAHELSGGDTNYLEATTKASDSSVTRTQPFSSIPAKPRAFALKASYMRTVVDKGMNGHAIARNGRQKEMSLEELVRSRFAPFLGKTSSQLATQFELNSKAKGFFASITNRILGLREKDRVLDFEKAGLKVKTIRIKPNGVPKEDISFPAMDYREIIQQDWEDSDLYNDLSSRYLFVIFEIEKTDKQEVSRLRDVVFWTMPLDDIDTHAKACFKETVTRIIQGRSHELPKKSENLCVHVRPHASNRNDTCETPQGDFVTKKSFWLNASYIASELHRLRKK